MEPCTFQSKDRKIKKSSPRKFPILHETETPKKLMFSQKKAVLMFREKGTPKRKL